MTTKEEIARQAADEINNGASAYLVVLGALAAMPAEPQADDWSVDDTICARTILNYLGIGDDPSLDQYADRRRAKVAAFIADRVQSALAAMPAQGVRVKANLPAIGIELYERYSVMSAQTHEALVKEYARGASKDLAAENDRLREALEFYSCPADNCDCVPGKENAESVWCGFRARKALEERT